MLVLAALLFLALIALERINAETTRLVKKLDMVGYVRSLARPFVHPFSF
jgi:hypothetical protein